MRADKFLATQGFYESRAKAREAIEAGLVKADGLVVSKPSQILSTEMSIDATAPYPWVSRAGLKLEHALRVFNVSVKDRTCLDVGASTGGFSHVLAQSGAGVIYAVDVGRDQLHHTLKTHPKIISMEQTDARNLNAVDFKDPPELIVCDVSFISCMKALQRPLDLAASKADLVTLVKPQFEVGKDGVGKGGIVRDQALSERAVENVKNWLISRGWQIRNQDISPIKGGSGNTEYLLHASLLD